MAERNRIYDDIRQDTYSDIKNKDEIKKEDWNTDKTHAGETAADETAEKGCRIRNGTYGTVGKKYTRKDHAGRYGNKINGIKYRKERWDCQI